MKKPEKVLNTGQLLQWLEENDQKVMDDYKVAKELHYGIRWDFLQWKYNCLEKNQKLIQTPSSLQIFVACKDGEPMQEPGSAPIYTHSKDYILEYQQAQKKVLFEGWAYYLPDEIITNPKLMNGSQIIEITEKGWVTEKDWRVYLKTRTIEDFIIQQIELTPADHFWAKIGL